MKLTKIFWIVVLFLIVIFAYYLRNDNYAKVPFPGESMDEYSNTWVGLSLIQVGLPIGNSGIPGYKTTDHRYINVDQVFRSTAKGNTFPLNYPWFDHPPLLGIVTGAYTYSKGGRVFEDAQLVFIRKPMVVLGVISVGLLFLFLKRVFGFKEALAGSIIYATSPLAIIGSRMVQAENLLIPLFIASLITTYLYLEKQRKWLLWVSVVITGTALLVKLSAVSIILTNIFLILYFYPGGIKKAFVPAVTFALGSLSFLLFFFSYGYTYDFEQFLAILSSNSNRVYNIGPGAFYELLTVTKITSIRYLTDGWVLAGWLSAILLFFSLAKEKSKDMYILIPLVCYLTVFLLFGSETYGWYRYPFLPFLFGAIGRVLVLGLSNYRLLIPCFLILFLPIGVNLFKTLGLEDFQKYAGVWRWGLVVFLIFALSIYLKPESKLVRFILPIVLVLLFGVAIYLNLEYFWKITPEFWRDAT